MRELSQPAQSIVDFAKGFADKHPSDVRFELLVGVAYQLASNQEQARLSLKKAAEQPIDDPSFYRVLVQQLDLLGEYAACEITTEIAAAPEFYFAEEYHQQYLAKNPQGYCGHGGTGVSCPIGLVRSVQ
jgi:hypothetical protein